MKSWPINCMTLRRLVSVGGPPLILVCATVASICAQQPAPFFASLVFDGVNVVDVEQGKSIPSQRVVIVGSRIQAVGDTSTIRMPQGAQIVDARSKYLIPGLWDMHTHVLADTDIAFPLLLANGVTGIRDAGSGEPVQTLVQWKREIAVGARIGPRFLISGSSVNAPKPKGDTVHIRQWTEPVTHFVDVPLAAAQRYVDSLKVAGADFIKLYDLSREQRLMMTAAARRAGLRVGGHAEKLSSLEWSDSGVTFIDHWTSLGVCGDTPSFIDAEVYDAARCAAAAAQFRRNNTWVTLLGFTEVGGIVGHSSEAYQAHTGRLKRYVPDSFAQATAREADLVLVHDTLAEPRASTDFTRVVNQNLAGLRAAGFPILIGTDMNLSIPSLLRGIVPGFSLQNAMLGLALAGFTPLEALQVATLNPARALEATDSLGTVEPGKVADLVLLDADPLIDIFHARQIHGVVANGRYFDRAALDGLLQSARTKAAGR